MKTAEMKKRIKELVEKEYWNWNDMDIIICQEILRNVLECQSKMKIEQWVREKLAFYHKRLDTTMIADTTLKLLLRDRIALLETILEDRKG